MERSFYSLAPRDDASVAGGGLEVNLPRVHLVDDDRAVRDALSTFLGAVGYAVEQHDSGEAFLSVCEDTTDSVLVLDINLPGADAFGVLKLLRERLPQLPPTVLITGLGSPRIRERALHLGVLAVLDKPVDGERLVAILEDAAA